MHHNTAKKVMLGCGAASVICCLLGLLFETQEPMLFYIFATLGIALAVGVFVIQWLFWRCPCCGKHLPVRSVGKIDFCPYCGSFL